MRVRLREILRPAGTAVERMVQGDVAVIETRGKTVADNRPARPSASGFPATHWDAAKRFPKLPDDSGRFVSESRDRD
jgi:hypothetical protein